jgi:hypothetical protein
MPATEVPLSETPAPPASFPQAAPEEITAPSAPETALEAVAVKASSDPEIESEPGAPGTRAEPVTPVAVQSADPAPTASVEATAEDGAKKEKKRRSFFG